MRRFWPRVILLGVGGVVGTALSVAGTIATGGSALALGLALGGGAVSMSPAVYTAFDVIRARQAESTSPVIYATLAGRL
jgi:hypothetical protein